MLSKKNIQMMIRKGQPQKQRFGLRKLSIGVASVLLGLTFLGASSASADETVNQGEQAVQTELATPQPVEITGSESARQPDNDEVASSSTAEATPVSSEVTSQVVANSASAVQDQTPPSTQPVTSATPEIVGGGTVGSTSDPASGVPQQNGVEIKFHDQDDYNSVLPDYVYIPGKNPGDKITMDEILNYLPEGLEIVGNQPQEFEVTGEPLQSISVYVRHIIEEKTESKDVEQIIYGHYGTNKEILNHQVVTFTRVVRYDKYTNQLVVVQDWQPSLTFQDYTVVPKDGFLANQSVVKGTTVNSDSNTVTIDVMMKKNEVRTETNTVTRTIILYLPDGTTREIVQTVVFTRDIITNPWTNETTYGEWTTDKDSFDSYQAGEIDGVMPDRTEISQVTVKPGTNSWIEEIKYPQNEVTTETRDVTRTIKLILPNGSIKYVHQTVTFTRQVTKKANGEIVYGEWDEPGKMLSGYSPEEIDGYKPGVEYIPNVVVNPETKNFEVEVRYEAAYSITTEEKVINRVIYLHHPNGTVEPVKHSVTITREVRTNLQTGEKEYGEWTRAHFAEFVVPPVEGHAPDTERFDSVEVDGETGDLEHHVNYLAHEVNSETKTVNRIIKIAMPDGTLQTIIQTVTFVKHVTKHPVNGEIISETEWVVDGDSVWDEFTTPALDGYTPDITKLDAVTPDADTEDKHIYISYRENKVETSDKTINRVIKLILPDGTVKEIPQTVTFTYEKVINPWTGEIISEGWRQSELSFNEQEIPEIDGKKPSVSVVPELTVTPDTEDSVVEVRYEAAYSTATEEKTVNRVIHLHHPNGKVEKVNHTVTLIREVKTNLQTGEKEYGEWSTGQFAEFIVPTVEGHVPNIEKIELMEVNGETEDQIHHVNYLAHQVDANTKTVNRVIVFTMPDGTVKTITQTVTFVKHTTKHPINGEIISETEWQVDGNGTWAEFIPEKVDGYTPSQEKVEAVTPDVNTENVLVEISYKQNEKPTDPDTPDKPITPDTPDKPVSPEQPGNSNGPIDADKPAGSDTPANSGNSGQQGNENSASATTSTVNAAAPATVQLTSAAISEQVNVKEVDNNVKKTSQDNQQLPQTGEKQSPGLITGTMLVLVTLLLQLLTFSLVKKKGKTE